MPTMLVADIDIGGSIATVVVVGLGLFILNFIKDAVTEVGSQVPERLERINTGGGGGASKQDGPLFDDSGTGANTKLPEKGLLKKSKQMKADGTRYAPWMIIDESAVEKFKRQRAERKKKEQAASKKKGLF